MSERQNIYNETPDLSSSIITTKYYVIPDDNSMWNHREVEYSGTGVPTLRIYKGETKKVYKDVYLNAVKNNSIGMKKPTLTNSTDDAHICEITSNTSENWITVKAVNAGTYVISPDVTGVVDSIEDLNTTISDTNLIVVVEEEPTIIGIKWGHENPLVLESLSSIDISLKVIYDNNQEYELNDGDFGQQMINKLTFISSNVHAVKTTFNSKWSITPCNSDERCKIKITDDSLTKNFGERIENIDPLVVITKKNYSSESLLNAKYEVKYDKEIPLLDISNKTYGITIYGIYTLPDGDTVEYNIDDAYRFVSDDPQIVNPNVNNNTLYLNALGTANITATFKDSLDLSAFDKSTFLDIPDTINWKVTVIKSLKSIDWSIDKTELSIGGIEGTLCVTATYSDGSTEDISNVCSFQYDENCIKIEGNKIIPIAPGTAEIRILSSSVNGDIVSDKVFTITVIQAIEQIDIIDIEKIVLNDTELSLYIGEEKDLSYTIYPENATPQPLIWQSSNEKVVTVDDTGHIKVLGDGYVNISVGIKSKEIDIPTDGDGLESDEMSIFSLANTSCKIEALAIDVTEIKASTNNLTLYVGDDDYYFEATVLPENASDKELKLSFISDYRAWPVAIGTEDLCISPIREGSGTLTVTSVSNPDISTDIKVTVLDNRVKKVIINPGNDTEYEFYDDYVKSPEVSMYSSQTATNKIKANERWDDDDFPRYYCPINNSLKLSATVEPSGASHSDLIWYSSDGQLVKCTEDGIITPIRPGSTTLDMDGSDAKNDEGRRFPNTTWITAFNKKGMKAGVCQVRVTRNNITGISIGEPAKYNGDAVSVDISGKHNYDEDLFDASGNIKSSIPKPVEYTRDYVLWKDDTLVLPVTLSVQDPNFGPSNNIEWVGSVQYGGVSNWDEVIQLNNGTVSHANITDNFDWTTHDPTTVNNDKKQLNVELKAIGLGSVKIQAKCNDRYYAPAEVKNAVTDELGIATIDGGYTVSVRYYGQDFQSLVANASVTMNGNQFFITTPSITYTSKKRGTIEGFVSNLNKIHVEILKNDNPVKNAVVFISAYSSANKIYESIDKTNEDGMAYCPSAHEEEYAHIDSSALIGSGAKPGQGVYKDVDRSREVTFTVVDAPKDIDLCFTSMSRVMTRGLPMRDLQSVWPANTRVKIKHNLSRSIPMFIRFKKDFIEMLNEYADDGKCPLDDRYLSFAWFTSDPNVFVPIESTQIDNANDKPTVVEQYTKDEHNNNKPCFNLKGYGRSMCIQTIGPGKAILTIVNIMSGQSWERLIEVVGD